MERCKEQVPLTSEHGGTVVFGQDLDRGTNPLDNGRADEHTFERAAGKVAHGERGFERLPLAAVAVPANREVEYPERLLVGPPVDDLTSAENESGARRERWETVAKLLGQGLSELGGVEQLVDRGRLAPRHHE